MAVVGPMSEHVTTLRQAKESEALTHRSANTAGAITQAVVLPTKPQLSGELLATSQDDRRRLQMR